MRAAAQAEVATRPLVAARRRPPSWADPTALPSRECICTCSRGSDGGASANRPRLALLGLSSAGPISR